MKTNSIKESKLVITVNFNHSVTNTQGKTRTETGHFNVELTSNSISKVTSELVRGAIRGAAEEIAARAAGDEETPEENENDFAPTE